eukprot:Skav230527  [mRNA]  locus=scaffold1183:71620:75644:- [translate_table: standard]
MCHMCGTYPVMDVIQDWAVGSVDGVKGALDPSPILLVKMWDVNIGVLQPSVQDQPAIGDHQRCQVEGKNAGKSRRFPPEQEASHAKDAHVGQQDLFSSTCQGRDPSPRC